MAINLLSIPFPDFMLNTIIDPEEFDLNNQAVQSTVNELVSQVNINTADLTVVKQNQVDMSQGVVADNSLTEFKMAPDMKKDLAGGIVGFDKFTIDITSVNQSITTINTAINTINNTLDKKVTMPSGASESYFGTNAGNDNTGEDNTGIGYYTIPSGTGSNNTAVGSQALRNNLDGHSNTAVGVDTLVNNITGIYNTAVGLNALKDTIDSSDFVSFRNCVGLGVNSRVSGDYQVQLGGYGTTPYAYAALQLRSDERDKTEIKDTTLGLDFIMALKPREFKWDNREAYIEYDQDGKAIKIPKDGSRKRNRFHQGFIAQEVKQVMDQKGIDFAGFQDHKINGGKDVLTIGYQEFIAPLVKAIQEQQKTINELKVRIYDLEVNR